MSTNRRDVQLVISAKNEGQRVVQGASEDLRKLLDIAGSLGKGVAPTKDQLIEIGRALAGVERASAAAAAAVDKGDKAFDRQKRTLADTRAALEAVKRQIEEVGRAQDATRTKIVDAVLSGQDATALRERLAATKLALRELETEQRKLTGSAGAQDAAIGRSTSSLQSLRGELGAITLAMGSVGSSAQREMAKAAAAAENARDKFKEAAAAARAEVQGDKFSRFMGITDNPNGKQAARSAAVFQAQDRANEDVIRRFRDFAKAQEEAGRAADQVRAKLDPLIALEQRLTQELALAEKAWRGNKLSTQDYYREIERLNGEMRKAQTDMAGFNKIQEGLARIARQAAEEEKRLGQEVEALRAKMDPIGAIQDRLNRSLERARELQRMGAITTGDLTKAEEALKREATAAAEALERVGRGASGKPGFLGLKPYELQNLGYQINDVFTQLASGTNLTQVLAQQGGQLLQLFPKVGAAILDALRNPVIMGAVGAFAVLATGIASVVAQASRMREIEAVTARIGSSAAGTSGDVYELSLSLRELGFSGQEAVATLNSLRLAGAAGSFLGPLAEIIRDTADALGIDLTEATKLVEDGLLGDAEAFRRLQEQTRTYITGEQAALIDRLYEEGRAGEARNLQMRLYGGIMDEAAEKAVGPWTRAWRNIQSVFSHIFETMGDGLVVIGQLIDRMDEAAEKGHRGWWSNGRGTDPSRDNVWVRGLGLGAQPRSGTAASIGSAAAGLTDQQMADRVRRALLQGSLSVAGRGAVGALSGRSSLLDGVGAAALGNLDPTDPRRSDSGRTAMELRELERRARGEREILRLRQQLNEATEEGARIRIAGEIEYQQELNRTQSVERSRVARQTGEERERLSIRQRGLEGARREAERLAREAERDAEQARREAEQESRERSQRLLETAQRFANTDRSNTGDRQLISSLLRAAGQNPDASGSDFGRAFVNSILGVQGMRGLGRAVTEPQPGDVVIIRGGAQGGSGAGGGRIGTDWQRYNQDAPGQRPGARRAYRNGWHDSDARDFGMPVGTPLSFDQGGQVISFNPRGNYGAASMTVRLDDQSIQKLVHVARTPLVGVNQRFVAGQPVVLSDNTGINSSGPHTHRETSVMVNGRLQGIDPAEYDRQRRAGGSPSAPSQNVAGFFAGFDAGGNPIVLGPDGERIRTRTIARGEVEGYLRPTEQGTSVDFDTEQARQQADFNAQLDEEIARRRRIADQQSALMRLGGEQLRTEERRQAVENVVFEARQRAAEAGAVFDDQRRAALEEVAGREFDIANAVKAAMGPVEDVTEQRQALLTLIGALEDTGAPAGQIAALRTELERLDVELQAATDSAIKFWEDLGDTPQSRVAIAGLRGRAATAPRESSDAAIRPIQQQLSRIQDLRDSLDERRELMREDGNVGAMEALRDQVRALDGEILSLIDKLTDLWSRSERPEAGATIAQLQNLRTQVVSASRELVISAGDIQDIFAGTAVDRLTELVDALGSGENAVESLRTAVVGFATDFVRKLGEAILQAQALQVAAKLGFGNIANGINGVLGVGDSQGLAATGTTLIAAGGALGAAAVPLGAVAGELKTAAMMLIAANSGNAAGGSGAGLGATIATSLIRSVSMFHSGGIAGQGTRHRNVWDGAFANARRFHGGGIAGLGPREIPAILERNEEILTRDNPRHIFNQGVGGGPTAAPRVDLKVANYFSEPEVVSAGLASTPGQRTFINIVRRNRDEIRGILGV